MREFNFPSLNTFHQLLLSREENSEEAFLYDAADSLLGTEWLGPTSLQDVKSRHAAIQETAPGIW